MQKGIYYRKLNKLQIFPFNFFKAVDILGKFQEMHLPPQKNQT
jgi:hypothetical protein